MLGKERAQKSKIRQEPNTAFLCAGIASQGTGQAFKINQNFNWKVTSNFLVKVNYKVTFAPKLTIKVKLLQNPLKLINSINFNSLVKALDLDPPKK